MIGEINLGLVQSRVLCLSPIPQAAEQEDQLPQAPHPPFTGVW